MDMVVFYAKVVPKILIFVSELCPKIYSEAYHAPFENSYDLHMK